MRGRGYDVDPLSRWDGVYAPDGAPLATGDALEGLARAVVNFASSADGGGAIRAPPRVSPELARRIGWATQSGAVLYINIKGVVTTPGRQTATVLAAVFIVVLVAAIVLMASQKWRRRTLGGSGRRSGPAAAAVVARGAARRSGRPARELAPAARRASAAPGRPAGRAP